MSVFQIESPSDAQALQAILLAAIAASVFGFYLLRRKSKEKAADRVAAGFILLGAWWLAIVVGFVECNAVIVDGSSVILKFTWPRPPRVIAATDVNAVSCVKNVENYLNWWLIVETKDGAVRSTPSKDPSSVIRACNAISASTGKPINWMTSDGRGGNLTAVDEATVTRP